MKDTQWLLHICTCNNIVVFMFVLACMCVYYTHRTVPENWRRRHRIQELLWNHWEPNIWVFRWQELNTKLEHVMEEFRSKLPLAGGLVICSSIKERMKWAEKHTKISSLQTYNPRGRKKADSAFRNRVGKRADALHKASDKHVLHSVPKYVGPKTDIVEYRFADMKMGKRVKQYRYYSHKS